MRSYLIAGTLGIAMIAGLSSCEESVSKRDHDNIVSKLEERDAEISDSLKREYIITLSQIDRNLDFIRGKQGYLTMGHNNSERGLSKKEQILNSIKFINTLLDENKTKLDNLEKTLVRYKRNKEELMLAINLAKERISLQETMIADFKKEVAEYKFKNGELNQRLEEKTLLSEMLEMDNGRLNKEANKVYFTYGTYNELKERKIIKKEGGLLGLGKVKTLNENVEREKFAALDQKENTAISIQGKEPKLITSHPAGSYSVNMVDDHLAMLLINDPESFWKNSRYLVVEVK